MRIELNGYSLREAQAAAWRILLETRERPKAPGPFARYRTAFGRSERSGSSGD